jgi:uncharacterized protein YndB with AHSA1/START domain
MLKKILIGLAVVIVLFLVVVATRPDTFHVERSGTVNAPPEAVFAVINDFHHWGEWSPWEKLDPAMKKDYEGGPGVGAKYHWAGNDKVGEGRMTITDAHAPDKVAIKLEFMKPWEATNATTFTLKPAGAGTSVTWAMDGNQNFMAKAFGLFMNMDSMIGKDFEQGLANLNAPAGAEAKKEADEAAAKAAAAAAAAQPSPSPAPVAPPPVPAKKGKKK